MNENIIQQIVEKIQEIYIENANKLAKGVNIHEITKLTNKEIQKIGIMILKENLERLDEKIKEIDGRKERYKIDGSVYKKILCELGEIKFKKTRYYDEKEKEYIYLIDKYMSIGSSERMTDGVRERILEEVIESSYRKGGERATETIKLSKGTTKNIIDSLREENIKVEKKKKEKKEVEYLYIDCDEAHINIQKNGKKKQNTISKLIYVYEGIEKDNYKSKRKHLIEPYFISGLYLKNKGNISMFEEANRYIENNYDVNKIKKIYINGDGAKWIKEGENIILKSEFVIDKFHLNKYINQAVRHLKDTQDEAKELIYKTIKNKDMNTLKKIFNQLSLYTQEKTELQKIKNTYVYINNNLEAIQRRLSGDKKIIGCSAEGHVSHVLADRMTSRPMGWSMSNANKMSKLRAYKLNNGSIEELLKRQRYSINFTQNYGLERIRQQEKIKTKELSKTVSKIYTKYYGVYNVELSQQIKKRFYIQGIL